MLRVFIAPILAVSLVFLMACDRNIEPYEPGEEPSAPDLARIFPGPPGNVGSGESPGGGEIRTARAAMPPTRTGAAATPESAGGPGGPIRGRIDVSAEAIEAAPGGGVLFVIARAQGARGGPPLAVLRIPEPSFPLDFSIGQENVMVPGMRFEGAISLSARLDSDGNAMTRDARDLSSAIEEPLTPGTSDVRLVLSERGGA